MRRDAASGNAIVDRPNACPRRFACTSMRGQAIEVPGRDFGRHRSAVMPVSTLRCAACSAEFVDSRSTLVDGDEAICPKCGARNAFTPGFAEAVRRGEAGIDTNAPVVHSELELKKQD